MNRNKLIIKYILNDLLAAIVVWVLFMVFRKIVNDGLILQGINILIPNYNFFSSLVLFPLSCIFIHYLSGYYLRPFRRSGLTILLTTLSASAIISISIFFALLIDDIVVSYLHYYYSLLVLFGLLFTITTSIRFIIASQVRENFRSKKWTINTLIVGDGANAQRVATNLEKNVLHNTLIGFVSLEKSATTNNRILGSINQIESIILKHNVKEVIVVLEDDDNREIFSIINQLFKYDIEISFTPRLNEILTGSAKINRLEIGPFVSITQLSISDWEACVKRLLDVILSTAALLMLSPFLLYCMIRVKKDSKGSVFFKQERIGRNGKTFQIYKFRTMFVGSESGVPRLSSPRDARITPFGKFLRKYRIDEIPQFWNVIKGDMSLVGPRPERQYYINKIIEQAPYYCLLYKIRPGLTSWGPIKIGYSDTIDKMVDRLNYDVIYLENMSLLVDLKIMLYTIEILFKGKGW